MNTLFVVILLFSILAIFSLIYLYYNFYKHEKFTGYLQFIGGFAIIFTIVALIMQFNSNMEKVTSDSISLYGNLKKQFVEEYFTLFLQYPQLNYYYKELMGFDYNLPIKRDKVSENQISMIIFARLSSVLYFIDENRKYNIVTKKSLEDLEKKLVEMIGLFFKSSIFRENWIYYREHIAGDNVSNFITKFFPKYF